MRGDVFIPTPARHSERSRPTLFLPASLLRCGRPAQRGISLPISDFYFRFCLPVSGFPPEQSCLLFALCVTSYPHIDNFSEYTQRDRFSAGMALFVLITVSIDVRKEPYPDYCSAILANSAEPTCWEVRGLCHHSSLTDRPEADSPATIIPGRALIQSAAPSSFFSSSFITSSETFTFPAGCPRCRFSTWG